MRNRTVPWALIKLLVRIKSVYSYCSHDAVKIRGRAKFLGKAAKISPFHFLIYYVDIYLDRKFRVLERTDCSTQNGEVFRQTNNTGQQSGSFSPWTGLLNGAVIFLFPWQFDFAEGIFCLLPLLRQKFPALVQNLKRNLCCYNDCYPLSCSWSRRQNRWGCITYKILELSIP